MGSSLTWLSWTYPPADSLLWSLPGFAYMANFDIALPATWNGVFPSFMGDWSLGGISNNAQGCGIRLKQFRDYYDAWSIANWGRPAPLLAIPFIGINTDRDNVRLYHAAGNAVAGHVPSVFHAAGTEGIVDWIFDFLTHYGSITLGDPKYRIDWAPCDSEVGPQDLEGGGRWFDDALLDARAATETLFIDQDQPGSPGVKLAEWYAGIGTTYNAGQAYNHASNQAFTNAFTSLSYTGRSYALKLALFDVLYSFFPGAMTSNYNCVRLPANSGYSEWNGFDPWNVRSGREYVYQTHSAPVIYPPATPGPFLQGGETLEQLFIRIAEYQLARVLALPGPSATWLMTPGESQGGFTVTRNAFERAAMYAVDHGCFVFNLFDPNIRSGTNAADTYASIQAVEQYHQGVVRTRSPSNIGLGLELA